MPSMVRGMRTTDLVSSSLAKRDVFDAIYLIDPYQTPITQFFLGNKAAKLSTGNVTFEVQEDVLVPHSDTWTDALVGGATTEADIVVSNIGYYIVGSVIRNTVKDENYFVTAVDTANSEIDIRKVGSGNITATPAGSTYLIIGTSFAEGSASATAISTVSTFPFNYTEIKKKSVEMSGTQMATENYGGSDWVNQRIKATREFKLDLERMWIYGIRNRIASAGGDRWFSSGLLDQTPGAMGITDKSQFVGNDFASEDFFFKTYLKNLFAKGSNRKTLYLGADAILAVNDFSKVKQQTRVAEKEYGVDVVTIITPFGVCDLVFHPILEGPYSNWVIGVDKGDYMKYRFLSANGVSRDIQYQQNIHTPDVDERKDQYLAQIGLHLAGGSQGIHRILYPGAVE